MRTVPILLIAAALAACQPEKGHLPGGDFGMPVATRDPAILLSLLVSTTTPEPSRQSADRLLVEVQGPAAETRLSALEQLLYAPGHSDAMRIYALDQLAAASPGRCAKALMLYLPKFEGPVLKHACDVSLQLTDPRVIDALIRSAARTPNDTNSPERPVIVALGGHPLTSTLYDRVTSGTDRSVRIAALTLLATTESVEAMTPQLNLATRDPWLIDLHWWLSTFNTIPATDTEMRWVQTLHRPENAALLSRAIDRHKRLADQPDYAAAPRYIAALAYASDSALALSRADLLASLQKRIDTRKTVKRPPDHPGSPEDTPITLAEQADKLSRADLLAIDLLLTAFDTPATTAELQRQGLADLSDTSSEHGGLLSLQNTARPTLYITPYPPLFANTDFDYISGDKLIADTPLGIAQYHFHFQEIHNAARAGPGAGDLAYAKNTRCTCVVITSLDNGKLNIDFYTPTTAVIDLGTYSAR